MAHKASADRSLPAPPGRADRDGAAGRDVYLLAHYEVSGRPFLQPRAAGLGLAGALLAELAVIGAVRVAGDGCR